MTITVHRWDDPVSWNQLVSALPFAHFQQSWEWGELAPDLGGAAVRLGAEHDGELVGAAQLVVNSLGKVGGSHLYIPRGPAVSVPSIEVLGPLLDAARAVGDESGAVGIRLEPNSRANDASWSEILSALHLHPTYPPSQPRSSWMLDITPACDMLLEQMKQKTRYNIRLATRKGVQVTEGGQDALDSFYHLYVQTARRDDFFIHPKPLYERMFSLFRRAGNFCLLLARHENEIIAAVTLIRFGTTCWYLHGASSNEHRNLMAPHLLQWEAIQRAKRWGCTLYDFRAVPDILREDQDMWGVYRFKEGFGGYQYTAQDTWSLAYRPISFGLWQLYFRARFDLTGRRRRRQGLPARQFA